MFYWNIPFHTKDFCDRATAGGNFHGISSMRIQIRSGVFCSTCKASFAGKHIQTRELYAITCQNVLTSERRVLPHCITQFATHFVLPLCATMKEEISVCNPLLVENSGTMSWASRVLSNKAKAGSHRRIQVIHPHRIAEPLSQLDNEQCAREVTPEPWEDLVMTNRRGSLQTIPRQARWILKIEETDSRLIRSIKRTLNKIDLQQFRSTKDTRPSEHVFSASNHLFLFPRNARTIFLIADEVVNIILEVACCCHSLGTGLRQRTATLTRLHGKRFPQAAR